MRTSYWVFVFFLCAIFFANTVVADKVYSPHHYIQKAHSLNLSDDDVWLKLLHYEVGFGSFSQQPKSAIHDDSFFISENGKTNPSDELDETLRSFFLKESKLNKPHTQCQFPARLLWLRKKLNINDHDIPQVNCPDFYEWTFNNSVESISVVYASGYLENPATFYGHILLKLNSGKKRKLLDQSINYGVIVPPDANPISYILKSLLGGYDGGFDDAIYNLHTRNYAEHELRDLWEYKLNLNQDEVDFLVGHVWELLGKRYTYYFFQKNCAYRLAEILEIVDGFNALPSNPIFTLPRATLKTLAQGSRKGESLINSISYHPSRQSRLYSKYSALNPKEKNSVKNIVINNKNYDSLSYQSLSITSKTNVLDTLIDYYKFTEKTESLSPTISNKFYEKSLSERFNLPPQKVMSNSSIPQPPHRGRRASQIRLGFLHNEKFGDGKIIHIRPTYYDVLDTDFGHVDDSALSMGEVKMVLIDGTLKIRHADIIKIKSVNPRITSLPGDNGKAWKLKLSLRQQSLSCLDCLALRFEGDYGLSIKPFSNLLIGAFAGAGVQDNRNQSGNLFVKTSIFSHLNVSKTMNIRFLAELPKQIDGSGGGENKFLLEARQAISTNVDIRFQYEKNHVSEYSIAVGYYF
ncbi:MAG: hypothetical protein CMK46_06540 [Porticoccus sp.]|nr:hypothetical protein [Porticoccus sp.]|tara:strand:+ start:17251 stop:19152 length:1902 start_codon:yes stop_codon:yes gene_type:complete